MTFDRVWNIFTYIFHEFTRTFTRTFIRTCKPEYSKVDDDDLEYDKLSDFTPTYSCVIVRH